MRFFSTLIIGLLAVVPLGLLSVRADTPKPAAAPVEKNVEWKIGKTQFIAGSDVTFTRKIDGGLTITGETVSLTSGSATKGNVWIAASRVGVEGEVGGNLSLRTPDALINGHVKGDVSFYGMNLSFGPDARIDGDVSYYSSAPALIDTGAIIKGKVSGHAYSDEPRSYAPPQEREQKGWAAEGYGPSSGAAILFMLLVGLVALVSPTSAARLRAAMGGHMFLSFVIGLGWLISMPVIALLAALTIIGLPLTLLILLLIPVAAVAGVIATALALSDVIAKLMSLREDGLLRRLIPVGLAAFIVVLGLSLPAFGVLVWIVVVSLGIGATALSFRQQIKSA